MKRLTLAALACLILAVILVYKDSEPVVRAEKSVRSPASQPHATPIVTQAKDQSAFSAPAPLVDQPLAENEKESISSLLELMAAKEKLGKDPQRLFDALGKAGLEPRAARDANEYTGAMLVVRTNNALPGTRYFHAQVFQDEGQPGHMQHASFEIRPGSDSMSTALSLVQKTHPQLGVPSILRDDYVLWKNNGRVVSVKRLGADDLDSHFNAHSAEDVGSVWVVSEDEPEHEE